MTYARNVKRQTPQLQKGPPPGQGQRAMWRLTFVRDRVVCIGGHSARMERDVAYKRIIRTNRSAELLTHASNDLTIRPGRGGVIGEYVLESPSGLERRAIDKLVALFDCDADPALQSNKEG